MSQRYEVIVIGAGPAGYVAAIRCAQLGLRTACIDNWLNSEGKPSLGGTCLNAGCIPSKALLDSSELYHKAKTEFSEHGIKTGKVSVDVSAMMGRKDKIVSSLTQGIASLFKANGVTALAGRGRLLDGTRVEFRAHGEDDEAEVLECDHVILATGSSPIKLEAAPVDGAQIVDSTGALSFDKVPKRLGIIGAGVIGLEMGSVWRRLGSEVVLLEAQEDFLPAADQQLAREALKQFRAQGLDIRLGARVLATHQTSKHVEVHYQHGEQEDKLLVDCLVAAVGRCPNSSELAAPEADLLLDERGFVHVDEFCATNKPGVWAIGDLVRGPMLAHKGSEEGIAVAESIASGTPVAANLEVVPWVIYTDPELAWVGPSEQELKERGVEIAVGSFPFAASGRARAMESTHGMVKMIADAATDRVLATHIIGPFASELVAEVVLAMEFGASSEDIARTIHAHPTLSEAVHEAALAVEHRAIHVATTRARR